MTCYLFHSWIARATVFRKASKMELLLSCFLHLPLVHIRTSHFIYNANTVQQLIPHHVQRRCTSWSCRFRRVSRYYHQSTDVSCLHTLLEQADLSLTSVSYSRRDGQTANHDAILAGGQGTRTVQSESDPNDRSEQSYSAVDTHNESGKGVGEKIKGTFTLFTPHAAVVSIAENPG